MDLHVSPSIPNNNNKEKKRGSGGRKSKAMKLSTDPQSVAARQRRHRISDRFKVLQSLVPGGTKMDTVSMLEEAIHYVKFLKSQIWIHQALMNSVDVDPSSMLVKSSSSLSTQHSLYYSPSTLTTVAPPQPTPPPSFPISCFQGDATMLSHVVSFNY